MLRATTLRYCRVNLVQKRQIRLNSSSLYSSLIGGDRNTLAKAITLVESSRDDHKEKARELLKQVLERAQKKPEDKTNTVSLRPHQNATFRIGLSGAPGVGKSSFIETFGMFLIEEGHKVAVLAVDPSSAKTGGSILGDKTRMPELSKSDHAYVRPSPSRGTLGGVARNTNEAILLCEANGYDIVLVETVGVGQSETMVADMVDLFVLLVAPGGGDELQGMKKGIMELADLILVNKSDGVLEGPARLAQMEYISALKFLRNDESDWKPSVLRVSSAEKKGIRKAWDNMTEFYANAVANSSLERRRGQQRHKWMWKIISEELLHRVRSDKKVEAIIRKLEKGVVEGSVTSSQAADEVLDTFLGTSSKS
ncbi:hypothetical protein HDU76_011471 [Blyttiomyces sp. JEL0837]|nr:hypothetical protein HDU76_011471 [Blyttiomyces sp. JEL0837]